MAAAFRHAPLGEKAEDVTAEVGEALDLKGEQRHGGTARWRRRRLRPRGERERRGRGERGRFFSETPAFFPELRISPSTWKSEG